MARLGGFLAVLAAVLALGPTTGSAAPAVLTLDYRVSPRYGLDQNHDGLVDSITSPAEVSPPKWTALVTVRWPGGGPCVGTYRWTIDRKAAAFVQQRNAAGLPTCTFAFSGFTQLDHPYRVGVQPYAQDRAAPVEQR